MFSEKIEISICHNFLISYPIYIIFAPICREIFTLSFEIMVILDWTSPLRALEAYYALSCNLSLIFQHSDTKLDKKGGGRAPFAPPKSSMDSLIFKCIHYQRFILDPK